MTSAALASPVAPPGRNPLGIEGKSLNKAAAKYEGNQGPAVYKARFALQRIAAGLLYPAGTVQTRHSKTRDRWAVCGCNRNMRGNRVGIARQIDGGGARYKGVITCGSVWTCPVCAARIAEDRRLELQLAIRRWAITGGKVYLMSLTAPHTRELPLVDFLARWKKALASFKNSRTYKRISARYRRIGSVRSLEVTYGANGWHPHTHDLVFADDGLLADAAALEELRQAWVTCCIKFGLGDNEKRTDMLAHGFDLRGGDYAADYVAKFGRQPTIEGWGVSDELTRSHSKTGTRAGHMTPFALLLAFHQGDHECGALFRTYAEAFEHQRMLYWSPKLKAKLGIVDATDEDLARAPLPDEEDCIDLDSEQWGLVLSRDARGELLFWAAQYGDAGITNFLDELRSRPPTHRGVHMNAWARSALDGPMAGAGLYTFDMPGEQVHG